jgi:hypothetical protein
MRYPLGFRASDINRETLEFEQVYADKSRATEKKTVVQSEQQKLLSDIHKMKQKLDKAKNSRIRTNWQPPRLLC